MVTLDCFLIEKYQQGMIAREEVITKAQDPTTILQKLQELELAQAGESGKGNDFVTWPKKFQTRCWPSSKTRV